MSDRSGALKRTFADCREEGRAALVLYVTAGHPEPDSALDVLLAVADAGADVIELGVPFSDPLADGPTIQAASFRAIQNGVGMRQSLDLLARFREQRDTPVVVFSYLNPIHHYGVDRFIADAVKVGADGVLITDLPAGADADLERTLLDSPLDLVRLIAPTTPPARVREIAERGQGFLYYISRTGVTGARSDLRADLAHEVNALRSATDLPIAVGFGISSGEQAREVAALADGVIVGSALVQALSDGGVEAGRKLVEELRAGVEIGANVDLGR